MRKMFIAAVLAAAFSMPMGCATSYQAEMTGAVLYKNAAMNCPACEGTGFYNLGAQRLRCYHCKGIGLVMGWSRVQPSEEDLGRSFALTEDMEEESGD